MSWRPVTLAARGGSHAHLHHGLLAVVASVAVVAALGAAVPVGEWAPAPSPRSVELFRLDCESSISKRDVTLFANGTVRLREAPGTTLGLLELDPVSLQGQIDRLRAVDLDELPAEVEGVEGAWSERCRLTVALPDVEVRRVSFARLEAQPLAVGRLLQIADELAESVRRRAQVSATASLLPPDYRPRAGDQLVHRDGQVWRVVALTSDKRGVELAGRDQPLTLFVAIEDLRGEFVRLETPRPAP